MIKFYGQFYLGNVTKEGKNEKGEFFALFSAVETGSMDKEAHFKFFKVKGKTAEFLIRNLRKKENGKYASRKLFLDGYILSYKGEDTIPFTKRISEIDEALATVHTPFDITIKKKVEVEKEIFMVSRLEFADNKNDKEEVIISAVASPLNMEGKTSKEDKSKSSSKDILDELSKDIDSSLEEDDLEIGGNILDEMCD